MNNSFRNILACIHSSLYHTKSEFNDCDEPITLLRWDSKYSVLFFAPTGFSPSNPDVFSLFLYFFLYFIYSHSPVFFVFVFVFFCKKWGYKFKTSKGLLNCYLPKLRTVHDEIAARGQNSLHHIPFHLMGFINVV